MTIRDTTTSDEFARENGHPPVAEGVVCVDFDGTLHPWVEMFSYPEPIPGAVGFMNRLRNDGFTIVIFTSRLSKAWHESEGMPHEYARKIHVAYIGSWLRRNGIPYDAITAEKIPAIAYIDDKAIRMDDWSSVHEQFFGGQS